jgi:hypothetical protein
LSILTTSNKTAGTLETDWEIFVSRVSGKSVFFTVVAIIAIFIMVWTAAQPFDLVRLARETRDAIVLIQVFDSAKSEIASGSGFFISVAIYRRGTAD